MSAILPGSTIGILGGGQLGRMTAMAARSLGYRVQVLDPDPSCPARFVVDSCFSASWDDAHSAADLARGSDVVTLEIEQIPISTMEAAAHHAPVRPSAHVLEVVQDRIRQKQWLAKNGFPVGEFRTICSPQDMAVAIAKFESDCFIKSARGGYDGRGQLRIRPNAEESLSGDSAWKALGERPCVAEKALALEAEISILVARRPGGECVFYDPALNHHENQILAWSAIPAELPEAQKNLARDLGRQLVEQLDLVGLLVVEMFLLEDGMLLVNELAPRPHNSYHASERACVTSQFEQCVRAVCDLPLGDPGVIRPAAIVNLLGEVWLDKAAPAFDRALAVPGVRLHLYEKSIPRPGRKMGHLSAVGETAQEAIERVLQAKANL